MGHLSTYSAVTSRSKWEKNCVLTESEPMEAGLLHMCSWYFNWKAEERTRMKCLWNTKWKGIKTSLAKVTRWQIPVMLPFLEYPWCLCLASPIEVFLHLFFFFFFIVNFLYFKDWRTGMWGMTLAIVKGINCKPWGSNPSKCNCWSWLAIMHSALD